MCYGKAKTHRTDTGNVSKNNFLTSSYELDQFIKKFSQHTFMRTLLLRFKVNFQAFTTDRSDKVISFVYKHKCL